MTLDEAGTRGVLEVDAGLSERTGFRRLELGPNWVLELPAHRIGSASLRVPVAVGQTVPIPIGDVETPEMDLVKFSSVLHAPQGRTLVAATASRGATRQVILIHAQR